MRYLAIAIEREMTMIYPRCHKPLQHPLSVTLITVYLSLIIITIARARNPIGLLILALVLIVFTRAIVGSFQTGQLQMLQGGRAEKHSSPIRYWFHLLTQTVLWVVFNVIYVVAFFNT